MARAAEPPRSATRGAPPRRDRPRTPEPIRALPPHQDRLHARSVHRVARDAAQPHGRGTERRPPQLLPRHARAARRDDRAGPRRRRRRSGVPSPSSATCRDRASASAISPRRATVTDGEDIVLVAGEDATGDEFPTPTRGSPTTCNVGDRILDRRRPDRARRRSTSSGTRVHARVLHGGAIKSHKGMNLPGVQVSARRRSPRRTAADIAFAVEQDLEYLALSFVRRAPDIAELRDDDPEGRCSSSRRSRRTRRSRTSRASSARPTRVMVARGDLGVELPFEEVPIAQKRIISLAQPARPAGDHGDADARVDDHAIRARRAPRRATSPTRSSTAPTR